MRKISANLIFDGYENIVKNGIIILDNSNKILDIIDPIQIDYNIEQIESCKGIICPGFINTHCHTELSFLKNSIEQNIKIENFIDIIAKEKKKNINFDIIQKAIYDADIEMKNNGIVALADICNSLDSIEIKKNSSLYYHSFLEIYGLDKQNNNQNFENALKKLTLLNDNSTNASIVPHSLYSINEELLIKIFEYQKINNSISSIHFLESESENEFFVNKSGALYNKIEQMGFTPAQFLEFHERPSNLLQYAINKTLPFLVVHCTYIEKQDLMKMVEYFDNIWFAICPNSNLFIENKLPNIELIKKFSDNITIGTDSYASNNQLSILEELKTIKTHFPNINDIELIRWATYNGAKFLNLETKIGLIKKGFYAKLNLIETEDNSILNSKKINVIV